MQFDIGLFVFADSQISSDELKVFFLKNFHFSFSNTLWEYCAAKIKKLFVLSAINQFGRKLAACALQSDEMNFADTRIFAIAITTSGRLNQIWQWAPIPI